MLFLYYDLEKHYFICFLLVFKIIKRLSCIFQLKFGNYTNSNTQNSMVVFIFCFGPEASFFGKVGPKKSKLFTKTEIESLH